MADRVIIIGGGLAGAAAAVQLAAVRVPLTLLEKHALPRDKMCGEFISAEAALHLRDCGIDLLALGAAGIERVRLFVGHSRSETRLPSPAFGLSRRVLDEALLRAAQESGAQVMRGRAVRRLQGGPGQWVAELEDTTGISGHELFLASGKHDLRGWNRTRGRSSDLVAFKQHWRLSPRQVALLRGVVELFFLRGGYVGLLLVEEETANLCLVVDRRLLSRCANDWHYLLAELRGQCRELDLRLNGASPCCGRPLAMASIPYGWSKEESDGLWRLGDQAAVIPSFAGGGMAIALHSAQLACRYYLAGMGRAEFQKRLHHDLRRPLTVATHLSRVLLTSPGQIMVGGLVKLTPGLSRAVVASLRVSDKSVAHARGPLDR